MKAALKIALAVIAVIVALTALALVAQLFLTATARADSCDPNPAPEDAGTLCGAGTVWVTPTPTVTVTPPGGSPTKQLGLTGEDDIAIETAGDENTYTILSDGSSDRCVRRSRSGNQDITDPGGTIHLKFHIRWCYGGGNIHSHSRILWDGYVSGLTAGWSIVGLNRRWDGHYFRWHNHWHGGWSGKISIHGHQCLGLPGGFGDWCHRDRWWDYAIRIHAGKPLMRFVRLP